MLEVSAPTSAQEAKANEVSDPLQWKTQSPDLKSPLLESESASGAILASLDAMSQNSAGVQDEIVPHALPEPIRSTAMRELSMLWLTIDPMIKISASLQSRASDWPSFPHPIILSRFTLEECKRPMAVGKHLDEMDVFCGVWACDGECFFRVVSFAEHCIVKLLVEFTALVAVA